MNENQMSDSFILNAFLAFSGGFQDAYTFITRDRVFANAQTGNIVQTSMYLMEGEWRMGLRYLFPVLAYAFGICAAELIHKKMRESNNIHWRQMVLGFEIAILVIVAFLPEKLNMLANLLVSFSCAMQVQGFRKIHGFAYASTMCIGNLRSGMDALTNYFLDRDPKRLKAARFYFGIIFVFGLGGGIGAIVSKEAGFAAILVSVVILLLCYVMMQHWNEYNVNLEYVDPMHEFLDN